MNRESKDLNRSGKNEGGRGATGGLTWDSASSRLVGLGPMERNADLSSSGKRARLPDAYLDPEHGFRDLLDGVDWVITYRALDWLVAVHLALWPEFVIRLRRQLCQVGGLSEQSFTRLHVDRAHRVRTDARSRWRINEDLSKELQGDGTDACPLVFQTREATIEIRTRGRHFKEQREAEVEAEQLRLKASAPTRPVMPEARE